MYVIKNNMLIFLVFLFMNITTGTAYAQKDLFDESLEDILAIETELKADVGARSGARNHLDSAVPLDVITFQQIQSSGLTSLTDVLRYFVPGFNAPETSIADGSDHVRAFTLRGMSPDQVLVLVNGKRLHNSALLNVNGVIGRGSSSVDLDTVIVNSIEKIEILRDGAAAQYGSDAISGVINITLKALGHKSSISVNLGQHNAGDGEHISTDIFMTLPLNYDGFFNVSLAVKKQEQTQRAGFDQRLSPPRVETHVGEPDSDNFLASFNADIPQKSDTSFYAHGSLNVRDSEASAFFRTPDTTRPIYPQGFLPLINAKINDYYLTGGASGRLDNDIDWDLSNTYGYNDFKFHVNDSLNYSLGPQSPTSFDNGSLNFEQNTTNVDLIKQFEYFNLASGLEYRYEKYVISSGDTASYTGTASQGFAGFAPDNEIDASRNSYSLYVDISQQFNDRLFLEAALRYENFSDFGSTTNIKGTSSYKVIPELMLRGSLSTGFRAPSLAQSFYSQTSSFVDDRGELSTQGTFRTDHIVSQTLGAVDLKAEYSKHLTIGGVYQVNQSLLFMLDYFYTTVDDRIMLSNESIGSTAAEKTILAANDVASARFFTNAVNTKTQGVDIKINYNHQFEDQSELDAGFWYNNNKNSVTGYNNDTISAEDSFEVIDRIEHGQPKSTARILTNYSKGNYQLSLNFSRFGSYQQVRDNQAYKFKSAWLTGLDFSVQLNKQTNIAIGGHNIFDVTPNKWDGLSGEVYGFDGIKPYSRYSPFGFSGASYYIRGIYNF
jgi:iron complex outermembrane receptor protein